MSILEKTDKINGKTFIVGALFGAGFMMLLGVFGVVVTKPPPTQVPESDDNNDDDDYTETQPLD